MNPEIDFESLVARLLGRQPAIRYQISIFCSFGWPAVIRNDSYSSAGEPNPNTYYLVCPYLRRAISRLEDDGLIAGLQARVIADHSLTRDLRQAQEAHRREWSESAAQMQDLASRKCIASPNIAATAEDRLLKCLHAHFAWYLVHPEYKLGRIIALELGQTWCDDEMCQELVAAPAVEENGE